MTKTRVNRAMRRPPDAPPEWVCNAKLQHDGEAEQCLCADCLIEQDPRLIVGSPQPTPNYTGEQLEEMGTTGLYTRKPEFYIPCHECHKGVPVSDPAHVAAVRSGESVLYHFDCFPEKLEMVSPYVLARVEPEEAKECEDAGDETSPDDLRDEDGAGAEEERLQGSVEGEEPRDGDGEALG